MLLMHIWIKLVLIPKDNEKDLSEIPDNVKEGLEIVPVSTVDEVLDRALTQNLVPIEWQEEVDGVAGGEEPEKDSSGVVTH